MNARIFAFGSNMCSARLADYGVTVARRGEPGVLHDYRLVFNKRSKDGSGKANAQGSAGSSVWGVIYGVSDSDLRMLDRGEGQGYRRTSLPIHYTSGESVEAWTYLAVAPHSSPALKPYDWYKSFLVAGAREHDLPHDYITFLEGIEALEDNDADRKKSRLSLL